MSILLKQMHHFRHSEYDFTSQRWTALLGTFLYFDISRTDYKNNFEDAARFLNVSLTINPNNDEAHEILKKISAAKK